MQVDGRFCSPRARRHQARPASREIDSTLTDHYQTTLPEPVRRALKLGNLDKSHCVIQSDGAVQGRLFGKFGASDGEATLVRRHRGFGT
jgi:bifunctional DNA-binding transcriptional regulator/antitoxin component of YhaV-PrlF toxin-antitoxin module